MFPFLVAYPEMGCHSSYSDLRAGERFLQSFWEKRVIVKTYRAKTRLILRPQNKLKLSWPGRLQSSAYVEHFLTTKGHCLEKIRWHCPARTFNISLVGREGGRGFQCCLYIYGTWLFCWGFQLNRKQSTICPTTGESSDMGFHMTAVNLPRGEVKCCIRVKQHCHPSSPLGQQLLLYSQLPCIEFISLCDVHITPWTEFIRGISEGVRHLRRWTDPDLSAYTSSTARSSPWIPIATFPLDHWHYFLLHYMYSFPIGSWRLINYWKRWDKSGIKESYWNLKEMKSFPMGSHNHLAVLLLLMIPNWSASMVYWSQSTPQRPFSKHIQLKRH